MKQDKWIEQLHDKLAEHEVAAPDNLWTDIETALAQQAAPRQSRFILLRRWAVAASVAALSFGGGYLWWNQKSAEPTAQTIRQHEDVAMIIDDNMSEPMKKVAADKTVAQKPLVKHSYQSKVITSGKDDAPPISDADVHTAMEMVEVPQRDTTKEDTHRPTMGVVTTKDVQQRNHQLASPRKQLLTLGLYAMNGFSNVDGRNGVLMSEAMTRQFDKTYENSYAAARREEPIYLTGFEERQHHHRPISYGLTLAFSVSERLSLTTGVVYTKLVSDFTQVMRSQQTQRQQTLHYVGLPIGLSCRLWSYHAFKAYVSVGTLAYWNVATRVVTEGVTQKQEKDRMQWSFNGSIGAQYDVLPQLGLYVEPGLSYYPENGSTLQNYFKDKSLNTSLQVGLRMNINP